MKRIVLLLIISTLLMSCLSTYDSYTYYDEEPEMEQESYSDVWKSTDKYETQAEYNAYKEINSLFENICNTYPINPNDILHLYEICSDYLTKYHYLADDVADIKDNIEPNCIWYSTPSYEKLWYMNQDYRQAEIITSSFNGKVHTQISLEMLFDLYTYSMFDFNVYEDGSWYNKHYDLIITADSNSQMAFSDYHYIFAFNYRLGKLYLDAVDSATEKFNGNTDDIFNIFFLDTNWNAIQAQDTLKGLFHLNQLFSN